MKKITCNLLLCFCLLGCRKNEDIVAPGPAVTLLTFTQDINAISGPTSSSDDWVFITEESGAILDNKPFEAGQTVVLTSSASIPSGKINVTILKYSFTCASLKSYLAVPVGQSWAYMTPTPNTSQFAGKATLTITDFPSLTSTSGSINNGLTFTDQNGQYTFSRGENQFGTYTAELSLGEIPARICVAAIRNDGISVALMLNTVTIGAALTANFNTDFKPLDQSVSLNLPGSNYSEVRVAGLTGNGKPSDCAGNLLYQFISYGQVDGPLIIGYNDGYDTYKTDVRTIDPDANVNLVSRTYSKVGSVPTNAPLLNYKLTVAKNDVRDFSFTLSGNFHVRQSMWRVDSAPCTQTWDVFSPSDGIQKFPSLPSEFSARYPSLKTGQFVYKGNIFTRYLDGFTYDDYLKQGISGPWTKFSAESQNIQIK